MLAIIYSYKWVVFLTEANITAFMAFYRTTFPGATVLPKMHFMEMHMVPWLKEHKIGLGLMGEQGAESIHAAVNNIKRAYANMPDKVSRLKCILKEHHRQVCPIQAQQQPPIKRRKVSRED